MSWYNNVDIMRARQKQIDTYSQQASLSVEHIDKIKAHPMTEVIRYPSFQEAFDYVDKLFPDAKAKEAVIYKVEKKFLDKCGYKGVGGFYNRISKVVVIPDAMDFKGKGKLWDSVTAKITEDEVIVHELLHYASDTQIKGSKSVQIEEEFAYGNSVGYLRMKGHSNDEIIMGNFLPYLVNVVDKRKITREVLSANGVDLEALRRASPDKQKTTIKKYEKAIFSRSVEEARKMGQEIIELYTRPQVSVTDVQVDDGARKFRNLDLD